MSDDDEQFCDVSTDIMAKPTIQDEMAPPQTPGERLRWHRLAKGMTIKELAAKLENTHFTTISKLERGQMDLTSKWANRLTDALGIGMIELYTSTVSEFSARLVNVYPRFMKGLPGEQPVSTIGVAPTMSGGPNSFGVAFYQLPDIDPIGEHLWTFVVDPDDREIREGLLYAYDIKGQPLVEFGIYRTTPPRFYNLDGGEFGHPVEVAIGAKPFSVIGRVVFQCRALRD